MRAGEILRWLTPFLGPNMDPKWGLELDHTCIHSFRALLGPRFGIQIWTSGISYRRILLLPAEVLQDLRRTSMSVSVDTCFFSLCVPLCFLYSRGPILAAMFRLVFLDPILGAMKQAGWHSMRSKARDLLEARMAGSGRRDLMGSQRWQGQVWLEAWKPQVRRRELRNTKASPREGEEKRQKTPSSHTMCHTPHWASAGRLAFYYFAFLKRRKCIRGHFWHPVVLRKGSPASVGAAAGWQICGSKWLLFRTLPCDVAA